MKVGGMMAETLSKLSNKCASCPKVNDCNHKEMELCALAEKPEQISVNVSQNIIQDTAMPLMKERIESPLSPFTYKDKLEKALSDFHFGNRFMNGA